MVLLNRNKQLLFVTESKPGTAGTINASAQNIRVINPSISLDLGKIEDEAASPSIGARPVRQGIRQGTITFEVELSGPKSGVVTDLPPFNDLLRACGKIRLSLKKVTHGGLSSGTVFKQGKLFQADVSGAVGRVAASVFDGWAAQTLLYYEPKLLAITSSDEELLLTDTGGEYAGNILGITAQTPSDAGHAWHDVNRGVYQMTLSSVVGGSGWTGGSILEGATSGTVARLYETVLATSAVIQYELLYGDGFSASETIHNRTQSLSGTATAAAQVPVGGLSLTIGLIEDGLQKVLRGCRGECVIVARAGQAARARFTFQGVVHSISDAGPYDVAITSGAVPPRFVSASLWAGANAEFQPVLAELSITMGQGLAMREDARSSEGITEAIAGRRAITGSADPESAPEEVFALYAKASASTDFPLYARWGTPGTGNAFILQMDRVVIRQANTGDRGGKQTETLDLEAYEYDRNDAIALLAV
jgi:hypothetical protein